MRTVPALTDRTAAERWSEVRDEDGLWGDLRPELLEAVRTILETTMEDELAAELVASCYERTPWRIDLRNGAYHRTLVTELGAITDLRVPRRRLVPYRPSFLERAARRTPCVDRVLRQAFLRGLSTRETAALAETLTGVSLSAASVSRLARVLDAQVAAFHRRPIDFRARYLLVDGLWVSVRGSGGRAHKRVILAAYGIDGHGRRELLDYRQATSESSAASTPRRSGWSPPTAPAGSPRPPPRPLRPPTCSAAGRIGSGTCSTPSRWPSGGPACAACARSTGPPHGEQRWRRTGAGRQPGGLVTQGSSAVSRPISTSCSRCSPCLRRSACTCARRTSSSAPSASFAAGSDRSAR